MFHCCDRNNQSQEPQHQPGLAAETSSSIKARPSYVFYPFFFHDSALFFRDFFSLPSAPLVTTRKERVRLFCRENREYGVGIRIERANKKATIDNSFPSRLATEYECVHMACPITEHGGITPLLYTTVWSAVKLYGPSQSGGGSWGEEEKG